MPRSGPGWVISRSFRVIVPLSGCNKPAIKEIKVVLPAPEYPTIETNSPLSMVRLISLRISLRPPRCPKPLLTFLSSRKGISGSLETGFNHAHQTIQSESNNADRENAENDMFVDE